MDQQGWGNIPNAPAPITPPKLDWNTLPDAKDPITVNPPGNTSPAPSVPSVHMPDANSMLKSGISKVGDYVGDKYNQFKQTRFGKALTDPIVDAPVVGKVSPLDILTAGPLLGGIGYGASKLLGKGTKIASEVGEAAEEIPKVKEPISPALEGAAQDASTFKPKLKLRLNNDGTYTNLDTGEVIKPKVPKKITLPNPELSLDTTPTLPKDLQGAKPRYNIRDKSYSPQFESDIDKAAYITAQTNPSKRDADYLKFVMDNTGLDEQGARNLGKQVKNHVKGTLKAHILGNGEEGNVTIPKFGDTPTKESPTLYHGTQNPITTFDKSKNKLSGDLPGMVHFSEKPKYSELFSLGESNGMKRDGGLKGSPNTIPAKVKYNSILDLTKPIPQEQILKLQEVYPELKNSDPVRLTDGTYIKDVINHHQIMKTEGIELPFDVIKYTEHGSTNWAVKPNSNIKTPWGTNLSSDTPKVNPLVNTNSGNIPNVEDKVDLQIPKGKEPKFDLEDPKFDWDKWNKKPIKDKIVDVLGSARSVQSVDFTSALLRQGVGQITRKPFWTSIKPAFQAMGNEETSQAIARGIMDHPLFGDANKNGVSFTGFKNIASREESFQSPLAEHIIPKLFGDKAINPVRAAARGYTTFMNKLRMDTYASLVNNAERGGLTPNKEAIAKLVNTTTGRGTFNSKIMEQAMPLANQVVYSPRLMKAHLDMLNPYTYIRQSNKGVRLEYLRSAAGIAGVTATTNLLLHLAGGKSNMDMNSSDFGKVKFGDTHLDPMAGNQQYMVLMHRLATNHTTNANGKDEQLDSRFGGPSKLGTIETFVRNKLAPVPTAIINTVAGKDGGGNPTNTSLANNEVLKLYTPMIVQDFADLVKSDPKLLPLLIPGNFGMGLQTYTTQKPKSKGFKMPKVKF